MGIRMVEDRYHARKNDAILRKFFDQMMLRNFIRESSYENASVAIVGSVLWYLDIDWLSFQL
jgi:hypothetical protein